MKTILVVIGTRPEAIKLAPVVIALKSRPADFRVIVCVTAQHRNMLDQVLRLFDIKPEVDLDLMEENQSLSSFTARALVSVTGTIKAVHPDSILVQGDTTTAMVSALAGFYQHIPIGHVEAGLRTGHPHNPFPEEMNRRIISVLGSLHFAPTKRAASILFSEQIPKERIYLTGNTVIDALQNILNQRSLHHQIVPPNGGKIILVTAHRRESFGKPLENICRALCELARRHDNIVIVFPVHPNPNVLNTVQSFLAGRSRVELIEPLEYGEFVHLMNEAYMILTDSGGIQEEGPALGKPVLVMRDRTERPEAIEAGAARLVGTQMVTILAETERLLVDHSAYNKMSSAVSPFGDGKASERIADILQKI